MTFIAVGFWPGLLNQTQNCLLWSKPQIRPQSNLFYHGSQVMYAALENPNPYIFCFSGTHRMCGHGVPTNINLVWSSQDTTKVHWKLYARESGQKFIRQLNCFSLVLGDSVWLAKRIMRLNMTIQWWSGTAPKPIPLALSSTQPCRVCTIPSVWV